MDLGYIGYRDGIFL
jgi:hypothetical protein